jgi:hypothetical protein
MTWQENVTESFIRGIGKTSGTIVVLGLLTGLFFLTENTILRKNKRKTNKTSENETQTHTDTQETETEIEGDIDEWRFKKMFERFA